MDFKARPGPPRGGPPLASMPPTASESVRRQPARITFDAIDLTCCGGTERTYRMLGNCTNCRTGPLVGLFTAGHDARGGHCPACGCRKVIWDRLATPDEVPERRDVQPQ